ncbi:MAG: hypothetical protein ACOY81_03545 [Bacillota bacterium]
MEFPTPYLDVYRAGGVDWNITIEPKSLPSLLKSSAQNYPDNVAIIFYDEKITYAQLDKYVKRVASALLKDVHNPG